MHLDDLYTEGRRLLLLLWMVVEVLEVALLCEGVHAAASPANGRESAEISSSGGRRIKGSQVHCGYSRLEVKAAVDRASSQPPGAIAVLS